MARGLIHPLTGGRRIRPTSPSSRSARQLKPGRPSTYQAEDAVQTNRASSLRFAAKALKLTLQVFDARGSDDIAPAVTAMTEWRAEAGLVLDEGIFVSNRTLIAGLSAD